MDESLKKKRRRSKNFSNAEVRVLLALIKENKDILENKQTNAVVWRQKEDCWLRIAQSYAARTGIYRNVDALRNKYDGFKKKRNQLKKQSQEQESICPQFNISEVEVKRELIEDDDESLNCHVFEITTGTDFQAYSSENSQSMDIGKEFIYAPSFENGQSTVERLENNSSLGEVQNSTASSTLRAQKPAIIRQSLEDEKLRLIVAQRRFYEQENARAEEKLRMELRALEAQALKDEKAMELLELQILEKKQVLKT